MNLLTTSFRNFFSISSLYQGCKFFFFAASLLVFNVLLWTIAEGSYNAYLPLQDQGLVSVIHLPSGKVLQPIAVGNNPIKVVNHPSYTEVYVLNKGGDNTPGSVSIINTEKGIVLKTIQVGSSPDDMVISRKGSELYVANSGSHSITVIDTRSHTEKKLISMKIAPQYLGITPSGDKLYAVDPDSGSVGVINARSLKLIKTIKVGTGPAAPCINPHGHFIYIPNTQDGTMSVIDTTKDAVVHTVSLSRPNHLINIYMPSNGRAIYVPDLNTAYISVINPFTFNLENTIDAWVNGQNRAVIFSPDNTKAFALSYSQGSVLVIDTATGMTGQIINGDGSPLVGGSITPDKAYLVAIGTGRPGDLLLINLNSLSLETQISIGFTYYGSIAFGNFVSDSGMRSNETN